MGHKLLAKMGWQPGKGLGKTEQGRVEAVKLTVKSNLLGVGANRVKRDAEWVEQTSAYDRLLKDLAENCPSFQTSTPPSPPTPPVRLA